MIARAPIGPSRRLALATIAAAVAVAAAPSAAAAAPDPPRVMTRNIYVGADLAPVIGAIAALDPSDPATVQRVMATAADTFTRAQTTDFPARAGALAQEIETWNPYLVALQEVVLWRSGPLGDPAAATEVELDWLEILLAALRDRGLHYAVVSQQQEVDGEAPAGAPYFKDLRLTDRDVVLARTDLPPALFRVSNPRAGQFDAAIAFPALRIARGWASIDVRVAGRGALRFVNTHLEPANEAVKQAQARELVRDALTTSLPVVLAGDLNSDPAGGPPGAGAYKVFTAAGLRDTGNRRNTCCHAPDLLNPAPTLTSRIDHVLSRPGLGGLASARVVGDDPADRVESGAGLLWPSDHAGVVVGIG